ncbi:MAG: molybdopterin-dependent oxidoreductase [Gammaproteobacteria bacterium]|nr:molybdopterin-dependent oxidoreductase [Gammaproteobacteria bacterium]
MTTAVRQANEVRTTCPYCGVGCGIIAAIDDDGRLTVRGDREHPANQGRLCSKGAALGETVDLDGRLLYPEVAGRRVDWDTALDTVAARLREIVATHGPDAVAFYVSGQLLTEDYYVANKLMKGRIGSANIDTNSRLCMSSAVAAYKRAFGSDSVPTCYEDLEQADLVVLVGSNLAWCHPVLFQRIVAARTARPGLKTVVIDPRRTASCDGAWLHLPLRSGTDAILFDGLLAWLDAHGHADRAFIEQHTQGVDEALAIARWYAPSVTSVAEQCGLNAADVEAFYRLFADTPRVVSLFSQGVNQSSCGTDKGNSLINCHLLTGRIGTPGAGPFSITGQPNAMGGREVGGLANQLAAHMELGDPEARARVARFWGATSVPERPGYQAVELFRAIESGAVKAVWIMATNPAVSLPDTDQVRRALTACDCVIVSDCVAGNDTLTYADVRLPALAWGEKDGTVTNSERRISRQRAFLAAPGEARADWSIIGDVARRMGYAGFDYRHAGEIFDEHARLSGFENGGERDFDIAALAGQSPDEYAAMAPVQWPLRHDRSGTARLFGDGRFFTASGRANFVAVAPRPPARHADPAYPLILNTGRVRDHWHTMTRTGKSPRLSGHISEPFVAVHPADAAQIGLHDGELATVISVWGEAVLRAELSDAQPPGQVFAPMHWNDQFASQARIGSLVNPCVDPISGQPEFKHTPVRVVPYRAAWHGFLLSRRPLVPQQATYWSKARRRGLWHYELAGELAPDDWAVCMREQLGRDEQVAEWRELYDSTQVNYRGARIVDGRLDAVVIIGPDHALPPRDWLAELFNKERLETAERNRLLRGTPPDGRVDAGPIVCSCFSVGVNTLRDAIANRALATPEAIGEALAAGTNCGSCIPELRRLIAEVDAQRATTTAGAPIAEVD